MIRHYITSYEENGNLFVESWLQFNFLGRAYCFSKRKVLVQKMKTNIKVNQAHLSDLCKVFNKLDGIKKQHNLKDCTVDIELIV